MLFLPYSLVGPFAGALLDRWDRRAVLIGANLGRLLLVICGPPLAIGGDGLRCAVWSFGGERVRPVRDVRHVGCAAARGAPPEVITMNSVATAVGATATFLGANFMLLPRWLFGAGDTAAAAIMFLVAIPVAVALLLSVRFPRHELGPDDSVRAVHGSTVYTVATGWLHGSTHGGSDPCGRFHAGRTCGASHGIRINTLLVLVIVRHSGSADVVAGFGTAVVFVATTGLGSFLANVGDAGAVRRWGRYATGQRSPHRRPASSLSPRV